MVTTNRQLALLSTVLVAGALHACGGSTFSGSTRSEAAGSSGGNGSSTSSLNASAQNPGVGSDSTNGQGTSGNGNGTNGAGTNGSGSNGSTINGGGSSGSGTATAMIPITGPNSGTAAIAISGGGGTSSANTPTLGTNAMCTASGQTQATLLTPTLANGVAGNYLSYQLAVVNCAGQATVISAAKVWFDVDAYTTALPQLQYNIVGPNNETQNGTMALINGTDMFGHSGNFFHWETAQPLSFNTSATSVTFTVYLGGLSLVPFNSAGSTQLNTYLRFGNAAPVQKVVTLVN